MIKLKTLLFEKEETDVKFRKDAEKLLSKTKSYISKNADKIPAGKHGVVLDVSLVDNSYKDLIFLFSKVGSGDFSLTKSSQGSLVLEMPILKNIDAKSVVSQLGKWKSIFVHEMVHYYDIKRYKGDYKLKSARAFRSGDEKGYINTPEEFNAFYQQGATELWKGAKQVRKDERKKEIFFPKDYNEFLTGRSHIFWSQDYLRNLDAKYAKKFAKRLADLYKKVLEYLYD